MTNALAVCLLVSLFCCSNLASARQIPKECAKGPGLWCQSLRQAAECGAVGHCIATVWVNQDQTIRKNDVSNKFVTLFSELKDINDLINEEYLGLRVKSACRSAPQAAYKLCKQNTAGFERYLSHVLASKTSPETICRIVGMCNSEKLEQALEKKTEPKKHKDHLLGAAQCTWGPSYWCSNFSTGRECRATHHCVERVWSQMSFPEDKDDICKICTDMVTQARDQLQSNETQEELKEVFEGSCDLIPIKLVRKECKKLADDFVPELVETLASQMNPQAVCSVAGLCNNAKIDLMLEDYNAQLTQRMSCSSCEQTVTVVRNKFDATSYDDFLVGLLRVCRDAGSLSDSCSMLVFKYYEHIVAAVRHDLTPASVCHLSGQCDYRYHSHDDYTFPVPKELSDVDDVPCEFCEKLVIHLRDVLIANTTEIEFHKILTGLCKQTGEFKTECLSIVEQYADQIYGFLVSGLKAYEICSLIGICGKNVDVPVAPLLPQELAVKAVTLSSSKLIGADEANSYTTEKLNRVHIGDKQTNVRILGSDPDVPALPIERMFVQVPRGKAACSFCQYFLHYLQVELSDTNNEDAIKAAVEKACDKLPQSVNGECRQFVTEYGPAVIALLVQEIDPASVCPALGLCPRTAEVKRVPINVGASNCPLCLFAIEQLETVIKNNRSETAIQAALDGLCNHLSTKLRLQCVDFVDTYSKQLVEMLVANLDAQEICVYLKLCANNAHAQDPLKVAAPAIDKWFEKPQLMADRNHAKKTKKPPVLDMADIETNEIPDNTVNGRRVKQPRAKTICVMCEFVMKEIDDEIKDKHNEDEIKKVVHSVCTRMPKSVRADCDQFVEKYADLVISLLAQELEPEEVCKELKLCDQTRLTAVREDILNCAVCETVVMAVKKVLSNDKVDHDIVHVVERSCGLLPAKYSQRCHTLMEIYGDSVIHLVEEYGTKAVCQKIGLCSHAHAAYVHLHPRSQH